MKNKKLHEGVAIAVALLVVVVFSPAFFAMSASNPFTSTADQVSSNSFFKSIGATHEIFATQHTRFEAIDILEGYGDAIEEGDLAYVHYVGTLEDGTVFDNSTTSVAPFVVVVGAQEVIQGWDIGLRGMKVGGTRRLIIPAEMAYGDQAIVDTHGVEIIPANATLVFDVVLLRLDKQEK